MSSEELRVVVVVYLAAIAPLVVLLAGRKHLPNWVPMIYVGSVLGCAVGWELWVADPRLSFSSLPSVVADAHFVRRIERLVVPKSESMHSCGVCALCVW